MAELVVREQQHLVDVVDDVDSLAVRAAAIAADQAAPQTRQTDASVYRAFCAFVGPDASADAFTGERVRAYRDELERAVRSPATIAKNLSALRTLAAALGTDGVRNSCGSSPTTAARGRTASSRAGVLLLTDRRREGAVAAQASPAMWRTAASILRRSARPVQRRAWQSLCGPRGPRR